MCVCGCWFIRRNKRRRQVARMRGTEEGDNILPCTRWLCVCVCGPGTCQEQKTTDGVKRLHHLIKKCEKVMQIVNLPGRETHSFTMVLQTIDKRNCSYKVKESVMVPLVFSYIFYIFFRSFSLYSGFFFYKVCVQEMDRDLHCRLWLSDFGSNLVYER